LILTDISDPLLESAKIVKYMGFNQIADILFILFSTVFLTTRMVIYPAFVVYPAYTAVYTGNLALPFGGFLFPFLIILQILFLYWSSIILKIGLDLMLGRGAKDTREED